MQRISPAAAQKAPVAALGFQVQCNKLAIIVCLLLGEIPERTFFIQKGMDQALRPYFELTNDLLAREWTVLSHHHVYHEENGMADGLAMRGREQACTIQEYNQCPSFVHYNYIWDILKKGTPQKCPMD